MKRFLKWIGLKEKLDSIQIKPPFFKEGEIWWCHIGENIGVEINGKSDEFTRPVLIFKRYNKYSFLGLPLSTKLKTGSWYVRIKLKGIEENVLLSQSRVFDCHRLKEKMGEVEKDQIEKVTTQFKRLHL